MVLAPVARGQSAFALGLSSLLRAKREPEMVLAPVRGAERFFIKANCSLLMSKENQKTTSDFDALDPRIKGCSPLIIPKRKSKRKKASRFAKRFFLVSPIYGFAEGVTFQQDFTFSKGVKSAAKQQIGGELKCG